jgi:hypothetical protein
VYVSFRDELYWPWWRTLFTSNSSHLSVIEPAYYYRLFHDYGIAPPQPTVLTVYVNTTYQGILSTYYRNKTQLTSTDTTADKGDYDDDDDDDEGDRKVSYTERPSAGMDTADIEQIIQLLQSPTYQHTPRIVLDIRHVSLGCAYRGGPTAYNVPRSTQETVSSRQALMRWADSSVSSWNEPTDTGTITYSNRNKDHDDNKEAVECDRALTTDTESAPSTLSTAAVRKYYYLPLPALSERASEVFANEFQDTYRLCSRVLLPTIGNRSCFGKCK